MCIYLVLIIDLFPTRYFVRPDVRCGIFLVILVCISGAQFKAIVEYAPSQRVPKQWFKKDGRDGTILKGTA